MILFVSAVLAFANLRFAGEAGQRRFAALSDKRARVQHEYHRGAGMKGYLLAVGAISFVDAGVSAWLGSVRGTVAALAALGLTVLAA